MIYKKIRLGNRLPKYSLADLIAQCNPDEPVPEDIAASERMQPVGKEIVDSSVLNSEWGKRMIDNMDRMARDEEYRKTIAKDLS
jgi:hypothetical protein